MKQKSEVKNREERRQLDLPHSRSRKLPSSQPLISNFLRTRSPDPEDGRLSDRGKELDAETADSCSGDTSDLNTDLDTDDGNVSLSELYQQITDDSGLSKGPSHCGEIGDVSLGHTGDGNVPEQLDTDRMGEPASGGHDPGVGSEINHNNSDRCGDINKNLVSICSISDSMIDGGVINVDLEQPPSSSSSLSITEGSPRLVHQETSTMPVSAQESAEDVLAVISTQVLEEMEFDDHVDYFSPTIGPTFSGVMACIGVQIHASETAAEDPDHLDESFSSLNLSDKDLLRICV